MDDSSLRTAVAAWLDDAAATRRALAAQAAPLPVAAAALDRITACARDEGSADNLLGLAVDAAGGCLASRYF